MFDIKQFVGVTLRKGNIMKIQDIIGMASRVALFVTIAMASDTYAAAVQVSSVEQAFADNEYGTKRPATFGFLKDAYGQKEASDSDVSIFTNAVSKDQSALVSSMVTKLNNMKSILLTFLTTPGAIGISPDDTAEVPQVKFYPYRSMLGMGQQDGFDDEGTSEMLAWLKGEATLDENDDDAVLYDESGSLTALQLIQKQSHYDLRSYALQTCEQVYFHLTNELGIANHGMAYGQSKIVENINYMLETLLNNLKSSANYGYETRMGKAEYSEDTTKKYMDPSYTAIQQINEDPSVSQDDKDLISELTA